MISYPNKQYNTFDVTTSIVDLISTYLQKFHHKYFLLLFQSLYIKVQFYFTSKLSNLLAIKFFISRQTVCKKLVSNKPSEKSPDCNIKP